VNRATCYAVVGRILVAGFSYGPHFSEHALQLIAFVDSLCINTPILEHSSICIEAFTALPVVRE